MKKIISIAAIAMTFAACSNDDVIEYTNQDINIRTTIGTMTKTAIDGENTTKFVEGDKFSFYAWDGTASATNTPWISNVAITLNDNNKWTPASQILWKTEKTKHDFIGVYPASIIGTDTDLANVEYTMNDEGDVIANDILRAYSNAVVMPKEGGVLSLNFKHIMAKLQVNLKFRNQWDEAPTVTSVYANIAQACNINFYDGTVTPVSTYAGRALTAMKTTAEGYAYSYEIIAVPNDGEFSMITITIDGKTYTYTYSPEDATDNESLDLVSGNITTVNLIVGRDKIEFDGVTIEDWNKGSLYEGNAYGDE